MLLSNTGQQLSCSIFYHLYVVVQFVWIAAFWVSTKFEHFRYDSPAQKSYCLFCALVISTSAFFCAFFQKEWIAELIAAAPRPLISILPINSKNRNWRNYP